MFTSWNALPSDPLEAYNILRTLPEEDLKSSYLTVYTTGTGTIGIGWWNSFVVDGASILARHADNVYMAQLVENAEPYKAYPLRADASPSGAMSLNLIKEIAFLFEAMGAGLPVQEDQVNTDPVYTALHHSLFNGSAVQNWAKTIHQITTSSADTQKPLVWTVYQVPVEIQRKLPSGGRLLAIDRFRYIEVSSTESTPRKNSTYMNEKLALLQGNPEDKSLTFKFYKASRDSIPGAELTINNRWSVFDLYLRRDRIADDMGNSYIPLFLQDEAGQYVYYLQVEFNTEIPGPSSWYSSRDWPDIIIADGMITEKK
jgi:hypothetical protein